MGDRDGAAEVARNVVARPAAPGDRIRLAAVLLDTGQPTLAASLAQSTLEEVDGAERARATLLLAKAQWTLGQTAPARDTVRRLTSQASTPPSLLPAAVLLHADCEFALGRAREAEALYLRAAELPLSDADASWVGLQLGNLARRDGRNEEARKRWQETTEQWPDTFYASQAAWFLRVADRMQKLTDVEGGRG
jgi:tetratricopeptide (TPR) repeat protein